MRSAIVLLIFSLGMTACGQGPAYVEMPTATHTEFKELPSPKKPARTSEEERTGSMPESSKPTCAGLTETDCIAHAACEWIARTSKVGNDVRSPADYCRRKA